MAEEKKVLPKTINPGYNINQGRGGQGIIMDNTGNTFIYGPNKTNYSGLGLSLNGATSGIFIQGGQVDNIVETNFSYASKNFNTVNNKPEEIGTKKVIQPQRQQTTTASLAEAKDTPPSTQSYQPQQKQKIEEEETIEIVFLPAVESTLTNIYDDKIEGIPIDVYIGLPPEVKVNVVSKTQTTAVLSSSTGFSLSGIKTNKGVQSHYPDPYYLNITGPYSNIKSQNLSYNNFIQVFVSSIATVEGWNTTSISGCQRRNNNPGNIRGKGDKGIGYCDSGGGNEFAKFSTLKKGWEGMIQKIVLPYINGTTRALNYAGATIYVDLFKETDNQYFKLNGIEYKELNSYAYKSGPSTFRQFFHQYAPWGDGRNSPVQYMTNVILTLKKYGINIKSVDDLIKNYI